MTKLKFSVATTPVELRNLSLILNGMADQIEKNITVVGEPEFLGKFLLADDGSELDVFSNTPLTSKQAMMLPSDILEKHTGRILAGSERDNEQVNTAINTAADAFGDEDKIDAPATDVELDADGVPWDPRIHAASKLKLKRGNTWKLKKGINKELVATVIAELKALMSAPAATTAAPDNVTNIADAKPAGPAGPGPASPAKPAIEVKYVTNDGEWTRAQLKGAFYTDEAIDALPIAGQTAAVETTGTTFPELMRLVTPALAANTITNEQVTAACKKHGVESLNLIAARPDLIPAVKTELFG